MQNYGVTWVIGSEKKDGRHSNGLWYVYILNHNVKFNEKQKFHFWSPNVSRIANRLTLMQIK